MLELCSKVFFEQGIWEKSQVSNLAFGHVKWTKFQKSSHLTLMDFAEILSSQCTHQEIKILKILLSSHELFQNYSHLNYAPKPGH